MGTHRPLDPSGKARRPSPKRGDVREVLNAIMYFTRTGCQWRNLPHEFPPWGTVHYYHRRWRLDGSWQKVNDALREQLRKAEGRGKSLLPARP
jgi:transposase